MYLVSYSYKYLTFFLTTWVAFYFDYFFVNTLDTEREAACKYDEAATENGKSSNILNFSRKSLNESSCSVSCLSSEDDESDADGNDRKTMMLLNSFTDNLSSGVQIGIREKKVQLGKAIKDSIDIRKALKIGLLTNDCK